MAPDPELRVFLDTNVIFSGLYSSKGAPGAILEYFIEGRIRVVVSQQVLEEVVRTFKEKLPAVLPVLKRFLLNSAPEICADPSPEEVNRLAVHIHIEDAAIVAAAGAVALAAAFAAKPDYFVTGDSHFLNNPVLIKESGIKIITPAELMKLLEKETHKN